MHLICYGDLSVCQFWSQFLNRKNKASCSFLSFSRCVSFCKLRERFNCLSQPVKTGCQQVHCRIKMCRKTYGRKVNLHRFSFSLKYAVFILGICEQISECGLEACKGNTSPTIRIKEHGVYTDFYVYSLSCL